MEEDFLDYVDDIIKAMDDALSFVRGTLGILEDKEAMSSFKQAEKDVKTGKVRDFDDFLKDLKKTGEI
jgi:hypothetical protein